MEGEVWKPLEGYDGFFVSSKGRVRRGDLIVKPFVDYYGYYYVTFSSKGKRVVKKVHCLVARVFLGERPSGYFIDHIDRNKLNNAVENLRYVTPSENNVLKRPVFLIPDNLEGFTQVLESARSASRFLNLSDVYIPHRLAAKRGFTYLRNHQLSIIYSADEG